MHVTLPSVFISVIFLADLVSSSDVRREIIAKKRYSDSSLTEGGPGELNLTERSFAGSRFTYYEAGLGACGQTNSGSEFVVALNALQYGNGEHCGETITISIDGKSHAAKIVDKCPGCPFGGLDFSVALFTFFAPESVGVLSGTWDFGGSASAAAAQAPAIPVDPTTTSKQPKTSTTTSQKSIQSKPISTLAPFVLPTSSSHLKSLTSTSSFISPSAAATVATSPLPVNNIEQMYLAFVQLGSIIMAGPNLAT